MLRRKAVGDALKAVVNATGFKKPTLVARFLRAVVVLKYLHTYDGKDLSEVLFVDAVVALKPDFQILDLYLPLMSGDLEERSRGIANFLRACFQKQPDQNDFELMLTFNAMVPAVMQSAVQKTDSRGK